MSDPIIGYTVKAAKKLATPVTINGVPFDGSKNISIGDVGGGSGNGGGHANTATYAEQADFATTAGHATTANRASEANYAENAGHAATAGSAQTAVNSTNATNATNAINAEHSETTGRLKVPVMIDGVEFDGSKDIELPGTFFDGTQDTTGNASSASTLKDPVNVAINGDVIGDILDIGGMNSSIRSRLVLNPVMDEPMLVGSNTRIPVMAVSEKGQVYLAVDTPIGGISRLVINEIVTIQPSSSKVYDFNTILGSDIDEVELNTISYNVLVKDDYPGSPTENLFINSEAVLVVGLNETGTQLTVHNARDIPVSVMVRVFVNTVIKELELPQYQAYYFQNEAEMLSYLDSITPEVMDYDKWNVFSFNSSGGEQRHWDTIDSSPSPENGWSIVKVDPDPEEGGGDEGDPTGMDPTIGMGPTIEISLESPMSKWSSIVSNIPVDRYSFDAEINTKETNGGVIGFVLAHSYENSKNNVLMALLNLGGESVGGVLRPGAISVVAHHGETGDLTPSTTTLPTGVKVVSTTHISPLDDGEYDIGLTVDRTGNDINIELNVYEAWEEDDDPEDPEEEPEYFEPIEKRINISLASAPEYSAFMGPKAFGVIAYNQAVDIVLNSVNTTQSEILIVNVVDSDVQTFDYNEGEWRSAITEEQSFESMLNSIRRPPCVIENPLTGIKFRYDFDGSITKL